MRRLLIAPLGCFLGILFVPASAPADEASFLYDPGTVNVIEMTLPPEGIAGLEAEPFAYQKGGTVVVRKTDGSPAGIGEPSKTFSNVEIKLKGQLQGSFQDLGHKAAFKLKFKKTETFFGLRKVTLNNMTQDPSMIHESLAYQAFAAAGVPASRAGYAYVLLNGTEYGLHLDIESLDTVSLPKIFQVPEFDSATQHLYEAAEYGADFFTDKLSRFEVDEGSETDESDLTALVAAVEAAAPTGTIPPGLAAMVDLAEMTRMWAAEKYIGHWDGYAGEAGFGQEGPSAYRPNNYYLYTDAGGRFSMLPWGTDQTWESSYPTNYAPLEFDSKDGRLFDLCLEDEACSELFYAAVGNAREKIGGAGLAAKAAATATMLAPWQAQEKAPRKPNTSEEIATAVAETIAFIEARPAEAEAWLEAHEPPEPEEPGPEEPGPEEPGPEEPGPEEPEAPAEPEGPSESERPSEKPGGGGPDESAGGSPAVTLGSAQAPGGPPAPSGAARRARVRIHGPASRLGRVVRVRVSLPEPGWVRLRGESAAGEPQRPSCAGSRLARSAGTHTISCRLSRPAWRQLQSGHLDLGLIVDFQARSGAVGQASWEIELPRRGA